MRILKLLTVMVAMLFLAAGTSFAKEWTASRVTLPAKYTLDGKSWSDVRPGMTVPNAAWINTGESGRVLLRRGNDTILIGAFSLVTAFKSDSSGKMTEVRQTFGDVLIDVEKRGYPHLTVNTPFMAAVVKGTKFAVHADKRTSTLQVERGLVEVIDRRSGARADVGAGGFASIGQYASKSISLSGTNTTALPSVVPGVGNAYGITSGKGNAYGLTKEKSNNAGGNSANSNAGGNSANSNAGGNSSNSNAGGNSSNSNAGGNSGNSNAGGNSGNSNAGGNSSNSNAGGNGNGNGNSADAGGIDIDVSVGGISAGVSIGRS